MKVKDLLIDESKWTKHVLAANKDGGTECYFSRSASCWCLLGAIYKCYAPEDHAKICDKLHEQVIRPSAYASISAYNDSPNRTFEEIRRLVEELDI